MSKGGDLINYQLVFWVKKRAYILKRDGYLCKECGRYGISSSANTVHHCIPASEDLTLTYCDDNLISLCSACHNKMHVRTTDKLTELGLYWKNKQSRIIINKKKSSKGGMVLSEQQTKNQSKVK